MTLPPGARVGPYEIVASIGAGGMGEVYRARDGRLDRDVALKILPQAFAGDPDRRARFEREARVVAALSHPNILAIFDVGESSGVSYAATELLEGQTLRERLDAGPLPLRKAIDFAVQIARGLSSAHDRGIVHRDLKPENLFLVGDGQIKILDFGLARQEPAAGSGATQTMAATDPGTVMGTVGYMAPEQVRGRQVDARADLFSLGVVLYEMVTGTRPFHRDTVADTMSAILREEPPEAGGTRPDLSPALDRIIRHCLEKEPDERFQTARDVAFALTALSGSTPNASTVAVPVAPPRPIWRAWIVPAAITLVAAVGGVWVGRAMVADPGRPAFTTLTFDQQAIFNARWMPDDETVVFSAAVSGNEVQLFELRKDSGVPRALGPHGTHLLSISGTGELAVLTNAEFISHRLFKGTLARMSTDSAPRVIATDVREADWLPDNSDLVVVREGVGGDQLEFPIGNVVHRTAGYFSTPRVSPDGSHVAFLEHPEKFDNRGWAKIVDRNGRVITLTDQLWGAETVAWSADGRTVMYAGASAGDYQLHAAPADGGGPTVRMLQSPGSLYIHDTARDGRALVTREDTRYGIVAKGDGQDNERNLSWLDQSWSPMLLPDGRSIAFSEGHTGDDYGVLIRSVDGATPARIGIGNIRAVSPDGRWVSANLFSTNRCVAYPTGMGDMVPIAMGPLERCTSAEWFPDSAHVLIVGNEPGKPTRAYRAAFPGGTPVPLLPDGVIPFVISATGDRVLARSPDGVWQSWQVGGGPTPVTGLRSNDDPIVWAPGDRSVVVTGRGRVPAVVEHVDLTTGHRETVGTFAPADRAGVLLVRPRAWRDDGRQYAYEFYRRVSTLFVVSHTR